jgi:hypothetical protein
MKFKDSQIHKFLKSKSRKPLPNKMASSSLMLSILIKESPEITMRIASVSFSTSIKMEPNHLFLLFMTAMVVQDAAIS